MDLYRTIRTHLSALIPGLSPQDVQTTSLGLSHSLSRHRLKFSPDKVDIMIIQAISLLDDVDKQLNNYAMRTKEWYGWHFPEMAKILNDNIAYAKIILQCGFRSNIINTDLLPLLPEEMVQTIKQAADMSMGSDMTDEDLDNIRSLAEEVVGLSNYRLELARYLKTRMEVIAPNLTALVGDTVGARLIAHAGSLINLAKSPASTIQILGAEKALFRALKTKHDTPKYGLIYHASLVGKATGRNKGKMARMLATKTALSLRVDALADWGVGGQGIEDEPPEEEKSAMGNAHRVKLERMLRNLEGKPLGAKDGVAIGPTGLPSKPQPGKFEIKETRSYNPEADGMAETSRAFVGKEQNGINGRKRKLIEEVKEDDEDVKMSDEGSIIEDHGEPSHKKQKQAASGITETNGTTAKSEGRIEKGKHKAEKAARKAERQAKRDAKDQRRAEKKAKAERKLEKAAKKAAKEAKEAAKAAKFSKKGESVEVAGKKRKHDDSELGKSGEVAGKKRKHGASASDEQAEKAKKKKKSR